MIGAIILGIIAGYLGRADHAGRSRTSASSGLCIFGVLGALLGFFFFTEILGIGDSKAFDLGGLPGAVIGVLIVLFAYDRFTRR